MQPIIQTNQLTKVYGMGDVQVTALNGVNLQINPGELVAINGGYQLLTIVLMGAILAVWH